MSKNFDDTMQFSFEMPNDNDKVAEVLTEVYQSLSEKGYSPISQIVGYLLSSDPAYIPRYNDARSKIRELDRDDVVEKIVQFYLEEHLKNNVKK